MEEKKDSELEEILEEEELNEAVEGVKDETEEVEMKKISQEAEVPQQDFDDSGFLEFISQEESVTPVLEEVVGRSNEVRLESVADEAPREENEEANVGTNYVQINGYKDAGKYSEKTEYNISSSRVVDNMGRQSGSQETRGSSAEEYSAPKTLERRESGDAQKYHAGKRGQ